MASFPHLRRLSRFASVCIFLLILAGGSVLGSAGAGRAPIALPGEEGFRALAWMPDGASLLASRPGRVAAISDTRAQQLTELWMLPLDGQEAIQVTDNGVLPSFSDDGRTLTCYAYAGQGQWAKTTHDLETGLSTPSVADEWSPAFNRHMAVDNGQSSSTTNVLRFPSPDGRLVATLQITEEPSAALRVEQTRTGERAEYLAGESGFYSAISWSPDSQSLLFSRTAPARATPARSAGSTWRQASSHLSQPGSTRSGRQMAGALPISARSASGCCRSMRPSLAG